MKNNSLLTKVKNQIYKFDMLKSGDSVAVGVSGGADSVCLLFLLNEIKKEISLDLKVIRLSLTAILWNVKIYERHRSRRSAPCSTLVLVKVEVSSRLVGF